MFYLRVGGINCSATLSAEDGEEDGEGDSRTLMVDGYTPLHWAVENGDLENVQMLLDHNADVNIAASFDKHSGVTALHLASQVLLEHFIRLHVLLMCLLFIQNCHELPRILTVLT